MKHIFKLSAALAVTALSAAAPEAAAKTPAMKQEVNISSVMRRMAPDGGMFSNRRTEAVAKANATIMRRVDPLYDNGDTKYDIKPSNTIGPVGSFQSMDGPNGETWHFTTRLWSKAIPHEYYTEYILSEYQFDIFDSKMNKVGTIRDKMRYRSDEVCVPGPDLGIDLLPIITKKFFNNDDKYEVVVSLAVNTTTPGLNHQRSVIYSLGGEKETLLVYDNDAKAEIEKVCDKPVAEYDAFVADMLDASTDGTENYYMTFYGDIDGNSDNDFYDKPIEEGEEYWNSVKNNKSTFCTYSKADANGKLQLVNKFVIPTLQFQGNQMSSAVMISFMHDGKPYMLHPYYKDTFYNPYYSAEDDLTMRLGNSLVIDMYELHPDKATLAHHTEIPMELDEANDALFTYYAVGSLRWSDDIDFVHFSKDGTPAYYITRSNFKIATDSEGDFCYYVYDVNGKVVKTLFEYADSNLALTDVEGSDPLHCFVYYDEDYYYYMVNLYTGLDKNTVVINSSLQVDEDSDPDLMIANFDRVDKGNGDWKYCFELRVPSVDEDENDLMRVAWFDKAGNFERIDYINMGKNVYYAQSNMEGFVLNNRLFVDDETPEYMILVKRGIAESSSSASQEELIIAQPLSEENDWKGNTILHLTPCEKGTMRNITVYPESDGNKLSISWLADGDGETYSCDFYDLPFDLTSGITDAIADADCPITLDGAIVACPGEHIVIYNMQGIAVAEGNDSFDAAALPTGFYLAVAADSSLKLFVK